MEHLANDYRSNKKIKNRSVQEESDDKDNDNEESFVGSSE